MEDVSSVIVNYGTPHLTRMAVWSLISLYPGLRIVVVDNASQDDSVQLLSSEFKRAPQVAVHTHAKNLHHGPALDLAVRDASTDWVLLFDSDCLAYRAGFLDAMLDSAGAHTAYMVGELCFVDDDGFNTTVGQGHRYIHPKCAIVRRKMYVEHPPFEKHGSPCLTNQRSAVASGLRLVNFPVDEHVFHLGRGTVNSHGYGLGLRSAIRARLRRLRSRFV